MEDLEFIVFDILVKQERFTEQEAYTWWNAFGVDLENEMFNTLYGFIQESIDE